MKRKVADIELSGIRAFSDYCRQFEDVVFLTIGEPDFDTPEPLKKALVASLERNETHYPPAIGLTSLRERIAKYESSLYQEKLTKDNIIITVGATEGLSLAMWTACQKGDEIIVPTPCFALYFSQVVLGGAKPVSLYNAEDDFQITKEKLASVISPKTKAIVLTSPNNPTGAILNEASLRVVYEYAKDHPDFTIILDDVYRAFVYEGDCPSLREYASIRDQIVVVQSFSKSHAMTGWRLGYTVASEARIEAMHKLHQNLVTGVTSFVQHAAEIAFDLDLSYMQEDYKRRRDYLVNRLNAMGFEVPKPRGAFYIFVKVADFDESSLSFAKRVLKEVGVAMIPGIYFGQDGYVRLSYCYSMEQLQEAMDRLERFMAAIPH